MSISVEKRAAAAACSVKVYCSLLCRESGVWSTEIDVYTYRRMHHA